MAVRDIQLKFTEKKYALVWWFLAFLGVEVLGKVLLWLFVGSLQIISCLDSQGKFQMFTLFPATMLESSTNMAASYWAQ